MTLTLRDFLKLTEKLDDKIIEFTGNNLNIIIDLFSIHCLLGLATQCLWDHCCN